MVLAQNYSIPSDCPEDDLKLPWQNCGIRKNATPRSPPALSVQLKEKRDAAILEKHKEGMSGNSIAKLFGMTQQSVSNIIRDITKNGDSPKFVTPESLTSTSAVPMASTEDRSETREDARS